MGAKNWLVAFTVVYFGLVFAKDGTLQKLERDFYRGTVDFTAGLKRPARLA